MKTKLIFSLLAALALLAGNQPTHAGPVGKGGFTITKPGKYTLIRNLTAQTLTGGTAPGGIVVMASDVELDLAGFTIAPAAGQETLGVGIQVAGGVERVRIRNGRIRDFNIGVQAGTPQSKASDCTIEGLHITRCTSRGIDLHGDSHIVRLCSVLKLGDNGNGIVVDNPALGLCEVSDCTVSSAVFGANGIVSATTGPLIVRRCAVNRFANGYNVAPTGKLFDNVTTGCTTTVLGNPAQVGVNH